jgi:hypothetical protein
LLLLLMMIEEVANCRAQNLSICVHDDDDLHLHLRSAGRRVWVGGSGCWPARRIFHLFACACAFAFAFAFAFAPIRSLVGVAAAAVATCRLYLSCTLCNARRRIAAACKLVGRRSSWPLAAAARRQVGVSELLESALHIRIGRERAKPKTMHQKLVKFDWI